MEWLRKLARRSRDSEAELNEELRVHLEMEAAQRVERGESLRSARNSAVRDLGSPLRVKETVREAIHGSLLQSLGMDFRQGVRRALQRPGATVAVILTLAVGIGSLTAIYSVASATLLTPLPFAEPRELFQVWKVPAAESAAEGQSTSGEARRLPPGELAEAIARAGLGIAVASYSGWSTTITSGGDAERLFGVAASNDLFETLGVSMRMGSWEGNGYEEEHRVALTHQFWQRRFGGRDDLIGQQIVLDGIPYTVAGILPEKFRPLLWGVHRDSAVFVPFAREKTRELRPGRSGTILVRVPPSLPVGEAARRIDEILQTLPPPPRESGGPYRVALISIADEVVSGVRSLLLTLLGIAGGIFLIACVNLASLTMAQTASRARELGIRGALGAGKIRLARQLLVESLMQALPGGALGLLGAVGVARLIGVFYPGGMPREEALHFAPAAIPFALGLTVAGALLFGLFPAWIFSGRWLQQSVRQGSSGLSNLQVLMGGKRGRLLPALLFVEVGLAVVILSCSMLMLQSFLRLSSIELGFDRSEVLTAQVALPEARYDTAETQAAFARDVVARFESVPAVEAAAVTNTMPLAFNALQSSDYEIPSLPGLEKQRLQTRTVTSEFFRVLGAQVIAGRGFSANENDALGEAVVNESLARKYFGEHPAVGAILRRGERTLHIVGVVRDLRNMRLRRDPFPEVYIPFASMPWPLLDVAVRTRSGPSAVVPQLRFELKNLDPSLALAKVSTMEANVDEELAKPRFQATFTAILTGIALFLAAIGIYGVVSYLTRLRTAEFGLRLALGATKGRLLQGVLRGGLRAPVAAIVCSLPLSYFAGRALESELFGVKASDVNTYLIVAATAALVATAATLLPAIRASRVSPMEALRHE